MAVHQGMYNLAKKDGIEEVLKGQRRDSEVESSAIQMAEQASEQGRMRGQEEGRAIGQEEVIQGLGMMQQQQEQQQAPVDAMREDGANYGDQEAQQMQVMGEKAAQAVISGQLDPQVLQIAVRIGQEGPEAFQQAVQAGELDPQVLEMAMQIPPEAASITIQLLDAEVARQGMVPGGEGPSEEEQMAMQQEEEMAMAQQQGGQNPYNGIG